jgi:hypothetical protein
MTKPRYTIQPQRYGENGWAFCSPFRATAHAVVNAGSGKVLFRYETIRAAKEQLARLNRLSRRAPHLLPQPGTRLDMPRSEQPIARSLTRAEYAKLKGLDA